MLGRAVWVHVVEVSGTAQKAETHRAGISALGALVANFPRVKRSFALTESPIGSMATGLTGRGLVRIRKITGGGISVVNPSEAVKAFDRFYSESDAESALFEWERGLS